MTTDMIIVLCILVFMLVMLLTHKLPFGVSAMICCVLFVLTGVADISTAFAGFSSSTTILVAPMIVLASALGRTSLVMRLRKVMAKFQGKKGVLLVAAVSVITIALSQLMGMIAVMTIMMVFLQTLDEKGDTNPGRMIMVVGLLTTLWLSKIPFGMGATMPGTINSFYSGIVPEEDLLGMTDFLVAALLPGIVGTLFCIFAYKLIPSTQIDRSQIREVKEQDVCSKQQEYLIIGTFLVVLIGFMLNNLLGSNITNVLPAAGVIVLVITKILSVKEVTSGLASDMVFLVVGMSAISDLLGSTGVGELIGEVVLNILGGDPSPLFVSIVFCVFTTILTTLINNMSAMALMTPIAASTALVGDMNVKAIVLIVTVASGFAAILPTGSSSIMIAYGVGNHNPFKCLKFTLPFVVLCMISLVIGVNIFFPIYG